MQRNRCQPLVQPLIQGTDATGSFDLLIDNQIAWKGEFHLAKGDRYKSSAGPSLPRSPTCCLSNSVTKTMARRVAADEAL